VGIAATIETTDVATYHRRTKTSLEEAARELRYDFLSRVALSTGANVIATAHTADDQVETIIMHWLRGAGLTGLQGMLPAQAWLSGLRLIRRFST